VVQLLLRIRTLLRSGEGLNLAILLEECLYLALVEVHVNVEDLDVSARLGEALAVLSRLLALLVCKHTTGELQTDNNVFFYIFESEITELRNLIDYFFGDFLSLAGENGLGSVAVVVPWTSVRSNSDFIAEDLFCRSAYVFAKPGFDVLYIVLQRDREQLELFVVLETLLKGLVLEDVKLVRTKELSVSLLHGGLGLVDLLEQHITHQRAVLVLALLVLVLALLLRRLVLLDEGRENLAELGEQLFQIVSGKLSWDVGDNKVGLRIL